MDPLKLSTDFPAWMREVDLMCYQRYGLSIHDLPDRGYRAAFNDGLTPEEFMDEEDHEFHLILE